MQLEKEAVELRTKLCAETVARAATKKVSFVTALLWVWKINLIFF